MLLAIIRKALDIERELHDILEILSASVFQDVPLLQAFLNATPLEEASPDHSQLLLFYLRWDGSD